MEQIIDKTTGAKTAYIRYGGLPRDRRSYNSRENVYEAGVSVYRADVYPAEYTNGAGKAFLLDHYTLDLDGVDFVSTMFITRSERAAYLVTGDEIGTGADGEPILANVRIVGCVAAADEYGRVDRI